jgi:hypothetical protein
MSRWTYIQATFLVEEWLVEGFPILESIDEFLKEAPKITGSERDAYVFVNYYDYGENSGKNIIITISGSLRDRTKGWTYAEYLAFRFALMDRFCVAAESLDLRDDFDINKKERWRVIMWLQKKALKLYMRWIKADCDTRVRQSFRGEK